MNKAHFPKQIQADRLYLKKHDTSLAAMMFQYINEDRARLAQFLPWVHAVLRVEDETDYIRMTHNGWDNHETYDYGVFLTDTDLYVGNIGVHTISWKNEHCELGYWILGKFEGKGYIREAAVALTNKAFDLGFNRVEIRCDPKNEKSAKVPKALGFHFEGLMRKNLKDALGQFHDSFVFSRLKSEGKFL